MLTIENVIQWEQLTHKRLHDFDGGSVDDITALGYVQYADRHKYTLAEYRDALLSAPNTKALESVARRAALDFKYIEQFTAAVEADKKDGNLANDESVTEICGQLITGGIDGAFLLSRGLEDLRWLSQAALNHQQRVMENSRFWAYLQLSPYIDKNKAKNAKEFLPFEWESPLDSDHITELEQKIAAALFKE